MRCRTLHQEGHHQRMVKARWNHVGIVSNTFCFLQIVRHSMRILTVTVFSLCTKVCCVHQVVRNFEQNRAQDTILIHCVFTFFSCVWALNNKQAKIFLFLRDKKPFVRKSETTYSDTIFSTQSALPSHVLFSFCRWKSSCSEQDEMIQHLMSAC